MWLNKGIAGDDTHGHIDDIARFEYEKTIFLAQEGRLKKNLMIMVEIYH